MWIRIAFWTGRPHAGQEVAFAERLSRELAPAISTLPGVADVKVLWARRREEGAPDVFCQVQVHYASLAALERMLSSPERATLRPRVKAAAELFDGQLSHIDYEV